MDIYGSMACLVMLFYAHGHSRKIASIADECLARE